MDDDRLGAEDSLLLFPPEPDRPARARVPSGDGALSEFLPEPGSSDVPAGRGEMRHGLRDTENAPWRGPWGLFHGLRAASVADSSLPGRQEPVWLARNGPAWCVGAALVFCGLVVVAAVWTTRDPGLDSLQRAANQRPGGIPPSDRSSLPELPARSSAPPRANAQPNRSSAEAPPERADVPKDDIESSQPAATREIRRAGTPDREVEPAATDLAPPAAPALEAATLAGMALMESRPVDLIPAGGGSLTVRGAEALPPTVDESGEVRGSADGTRAAGPAAEATGLAEAEAVRRTLEAYRTAYEHLDVGAAAEVWPTVDRRALTRAFSTLESQDVTLGECEIHVEEATATARCQGMVRFVPAFGSRAPVNTPTGWVFRMRKAGASWTIEDVSGAAAARTYDDASAPTR